MKRISYTFFIIYCVIGLIISAILINIGKPINYKNYCKENNISEIFVEVTANELDQDPYEVAVVFKYAAEQGLDIVDGLVFIKPDITFDEAMEIINISDKLQEEKCKY